MTMPLTAKTFLPLTLVLLLSGCAAHPNPTVTPAPPGVQAAMNADDSIKALGTISAAIEKAADDKVITILEAHQVLDVIKGTVTTLSQIPSGWLAVASQALDEIQSIKDPHLQTILGPLVTTARIALGLSGSN